LRGLFVVGTDTGVGKTIIAAALIHHLREKGVNVGAFKPVESGGREDSTVLLEASGAPEPGFPRLGSVSPLTDLSPSPIESLSCPRVLPAPLELVNPYSFKLPISPHQAAEEEGRAIDIAVILDAFDKLSERHDFIVAEGAGGLLVPLAPDYLLADLIAELDLPVLVVARAAVGTINHTLLTVKHAQSLGLDVAGIVINNEKPMAESENVSRPEDLACYTDAPFLGKFPYLDNLDAKSLNKALQDNLDLSLLLLPRKE
jgi:dethiobiotin synthetase